MSGLANEMEECVQVFIAKGSNLNLYALIFLIHMDRPKNCPVRNMVSQVRKGCQEVFFRDLTEHFFAEEITDLF